MAGLFVKKGDTVLVVNGKDKGVQGKVIKVLIDQDRVIVEGVNRIKKHTKVGTSARGASTGGIITQEAPIHVSNVMLVDPTDDRPTRVGYRREVVTKNRPDGTSYETTRSVRVSKRTGKDI
jgi:large subunit ribosomal protein L24